MIGIFDSGIGGLCSYERLRELLPDEELYYLADKQNAPYGTKDTETIVSLAKSNIKTLRSLGAERVLIACCTASGIYERLSEEEREISTPIILPAAREAARLVGHGGRVAVISTEYTARNHIFSSMIKRIDPSVEALEIPTQILVGLVELGAADGKLLPRESDLLDGISNEIRRGGAGALILGCTHFSHLREEFKTRLAGIKVIDTARLGAEALAEEYRNRHVI